MRSHVARAASGFEITHFVVRSFCSTPLPVLVMDNQSNDGAAHDATMPVSFEHGITQAGVVALFTLNLRPVFRSIADVPLMLLLANAVGIVGGVLR